VETAPPEGGQPLFPVLVQQAPRPERLFAPERGIFLLSREMDLEANEFRPRQARRALAVFLQPVGIDEASGIVLGPREDCLQERAF
jgi:hypothetical protein